MKRTTHEFVCSNRSFHKMAASTSSGVDRRTIHQAARSTHLVTPQTNSP